MLSSVVPALAELAVDPGLFFFSAIGSYRLPFLIEEIKLAVIISLIMDDRANISLLAGIVVGIALWLLYFGYGDKLFAGRLWATSPGTGWSESYFSSECGNVMGSCTAEAELKIDGCGTASLKNKADDALAYPMRMPGCRSIETDLSRRCPGGCSVDSRTMVIIPGELQTAMDSTANESGECRATAKRVMSVRAACIK